MITGRTTPDPFNEIARLADLYSGGGVRLTTGQNVILPNVAAHKLNLLLREPLLRDLSPAPSPLFRGLVACTGTDFCNLAQIETKARAIQVSQALERRIGVDGAALTIHWSGCPAACGNHQAADIGFRGFKANIGGQLIDAVAIYTGGRTGPGAVAGEQVIDMVPCDDQLPDVVAELIPNLQKSLEP